MNPARHKGSHTICAVACVSLCSDQGITLIRDEQGWRFSAWHGDDFSTPRLPPPLPSDVDRQRHFDSHSAAAAYFKRHYGGKLAGI
jgi:hypothetical protein